MTGPASQVVVSHRQREASTGTIRSASADAWTDLAHNTSHAWRGQARNAGGYGTWSGECSITTARLDPPTVSVDGISTRDAAASSSAVTAGSWVVGTSIAGGGASRSDLADGVSYTATATATDGHNNVPGSASFTTRPLPSAGCTMTGGGDAPATVTVTAWLSYAEGGVWAQARIGASDSWTTGSASTGEAGTHTGYGRATDGLRTG